MHLYLKVPSNGGGKKGRKEERKEDLTQGSRIHSGDMESRVSTTLQKYHRLSSLGQYDHHKQER
jgi:hypothetical protein